MSQKSLHKGIACMIFSAFGFAVMNLFVRLSGDLPTLEKAFFRNLIAFFVAAVILYKDGGKIRIGRSNYFSMAVRCIAGTIGIWCNFYAVDTIDLADASILNKLSPFFVLLFSYFILKEKFTAFQGGCIVLAFLGALFVIKPGFGSVGMGTWIGALGGLCAGLAYTYVRKLGENGVQGAVIVALFSGVSCLASVPYMLFHFQTPTVMQLLFLLGAGAAAACGQFGITAAYTHCPAREVSIYDYTQLIFSTILGYFVLSELPDRWSFIGYVVIVAASVILFLYNNGKIGRRDTGHLSGTEEGA